MAVLHFSKDVEARLKPGTDLKLRDWSRDDAPEQYVIEDDGLVAAVNAALILGQPLLLTGEPGTGKTSLAKRVAWQLGLEEPLTFETKSTSVARDLFYTYDAVGRFQAAHGSATEIDNIAFITFEALGKAIILTQDSNTELRKRIDESNSKSTESSDRFEQPRPRRSVVLIDEIDKAHRDFPNDLLNEIERTFFKIPERKNQRVEAAAKLRPVVIITSNSEKNLPDPFLRRCVYYHMEFPNETSLQNILRSRLGPQPGSTDPSSKLPVESNAEPSTTAAVLDETLFHSTVRFFREVRNLQLRKNPATAELIGWVKLLIAHGAKLDEPISNVKNLAFTISALAKNQDDLSMVNMHLANSPELNGAAAN